MKKSLILTSLIIMSPIFADSFLVKLDKKIYENRLKVVSQTTEPETPVEPEPEVSYTSCLDVMQKGASIGDGMYTITNNGNTTSKFCEMTSHGGGWTRIDRSEISNFNYSEIMSSEKNILSQEQMTRFAYLMNNIELYHWSLEVPSLLPALNGSFIVRDTFHEIPQISIPMPVKISAIGWTRSQDSDQDEGRFYVASVQTENNVSQRLIGDTGYRNWSSNGVNLVYDTTLQTDDIKIRLYGACRRYTGTQCSVTISEVKIHINYDLPVNYDTFYVR